MSVSLEHTLASDGAFVDSLESIFEHGRWIVEEVCAKGRPTGVKSVPELHLFLVDFVMNKLSAEQQLRLLTSHPDLAGRAAEEGSLSSHSEDEQKSAGLHVLSVDEKATFHALNEEYKSKFGFPFIICVKRNKLEAIKHGLTTRRHNTREEEYRAALLQVCAIAAVRLEAKFGVLIPWTPAEAAL
eukprot:TRINITY_DN5844_c0_g1_i1.p1 TRINITY_DN5844_c0_g1~~TRINITY_DN5844_c0_g1_i1.p1  ORF type:complete len:185 (+),score=53.47 TRINITY_DN5844_c0_g1_i1:104-658(+)